MPLFQSWPKIDLSSAGQKNVLQHDDIMKWKHFPRYWPFVGGIHRTRWSPRTKASDAKLWCFLDLRPNIQLSKQSWGWWFKTPSRLLRHHRNEMTTKRHAFVKMSLLENDCEHIFTDSIKLFKMIDMISWNIMNMNVDHVNLRGSFNAKMLFHQRRHSHYKGKDSFMTIFSS